MIEHKEQSSNRLVALEEEDEKTDLNAPYEDKGIKKRTSG